MSNNISDLGKLIVAKGFEKLPKVQQIAHSGHTGHRIGWWAANKVSEFLSAFVNVVDFFEEESSANLTFEIGFLQYFVILYTYLVASMDMYLCMYVCLLQWVGWGDTMIIHR